MNSPFISAHLIRTKLKNLPLITLSGTSKINGEKFLTILIPRLALELGDELKRLAAEAMVEDPPPPPRKRRKKK